MSVLREIADKLERGELPLEAKDDLVKARLVVCESCPSFAKISRQCKLCWCFMDLKVKITAAQCPAAKW